MRRALATLLLLAGCGAQDPVAVSEVSLSLPEVLACAGGLPEDLQAEAWVSGVEAPTPLTVDETGAVSGELEVGTGIERMIVVDWFVVRDEVRIMLAQARAQVDLTRPQDEVVEREFIERDINISACADVTNDLGRQGFNTISFNGEIVNPCDLDGDCGGTPSPGCANLGEICAGTDPLVDEGT